MLELMGLPAFTGQQVPGPCCLHLCSTGIIDTAAMLHYGCWEPNSGLQVCTAGTLLTKPSRQPLPFLPHEVTDSLVTDLTYLNSIYLVRLRVLSVRLVYGLLSECY